MATIGTGNSKLFFSRSKKLFKVLFTLISIASPVILAIASPAILADERLLTARMVCADFRGDSRKYDLSASAIWTEPLNYEFSKDQTTAIFRQAFIGLGQQAEFEDVISKYEIYLIQSCVDYMTLNHPVNATFIYRSAFHANVPIGSRFGALFNVLFQGKPEAPQILKGATFGGVNNEITAFLPYDEEFNKSLNRDSDKVSDEIPLAQRDICDIPGSDLSKDSLSKSAVRAKPLNYTISKDRTTAIFRQAYIGLGQQAEFEDVIRKYDIQLIDSCVDQMALSHPVSLSLMVRSIYRADGSLLIK